MAKWVPFLPRWATATYEQKGCPLVSHAFDAPTKPNAPCNDMRRTGGALSILTEVIVLRSMKLVSTLSALSLVGLLLQGAEGPVPPVEPSQAEVAELQSRTATLKTADHFVASGRFKEAIQVLDSYLNDHPRDLEVRSTLLSTRVAQKEAEIRAVLKEQAGEEDLMLAEPDYDAAFALSDEDVRRRLKVVEYLLAQNRFADAVQGCNAILRDHPHEQSALLLKFRILNTIVKKERSELHKEHEYRRGEGLNDVMEDGIFPRDGERVKRHVFVFQEDIDEAERAKVRERLQERITLNQDQAKVWDVMRTLFAVSGINYVVLDSAVGEETVSLHLVDDTVESALNAVGKLAKVRFSYTDGTVFVSSDADDGLVTEIIRLRSGLTDVDAQVEMTTFSPNSGGTGQNAGAGGNAPNTPPSRPSGPGANQQPGAAAGAAGEKSSDLEKLLLKLPDIIVGWQDTHKFHLDRKSNTLYLRANPWVISEVKRLLHAMDYNNVQVLIESKFIEVSDEALRQIGVNWGAFQGTDAATTKLVGAVGTPVNPGVIAAGTNPAGAGAVLSGLLQQNGFTLNATLVALERDKKLDTLAEPKILTLNNATGVIEIAQNYNYIQNYTTQSYNTSSDTNDNGVTNNVSSVVATPEWGTTDIGYQLEITPSIARNSDVITLKLQPKVKDLIDAGIVLDGFTYQPSPGAPFINKPIANPRFSTRTLETVLHIQNGKTVALGGLANEALEKTEEGTPFLMDIPILGYLFKTETRRSERRNLIILVTAHIVDPSGGKVGTEILRLRDTARILIPASGVEGMDPTKPVMTHPEEPAGPSAPPVDRDISTPREPAAQKGRRP